ncbi:hypothetical protein [Methylorubrum extorquens]
MNRRSVLRWLGLAPVAAPAAVLAASKPALPPIDYSGLTANIGRVQAGLLRTEASIGALAAESAGRAAADAAQIDRVFSLWER